MAEAQPQSALRCTGPEAATGLGLVAHCHRAHHGQLHRGGHEDKLQTAEDVSLLPPSAHPDSSRPAGQGMHRANRLLSSSFVRRAWVGSVLAMAIEQVSCLTFRYQWAPLWGDKWALVALCCRALCNQTVSAQLNCTVFTPGGLIWNRVAKTRAKGAMGQAGRIGE